MTCYSIILECMLLSHWSVESSAHHSEILFFLFSSCCAGQHLCSFITSLQTLHHQPLLSGLSSPSFPSGSASVRQGFFPVSFNRLVRTNCTSAMSNHNGTPSQLLISDGNTVVLCAQFSCIMRAWWRHFSCTHFHFEFVQIIWVNCWLVSNLLCLDLHCIVSSRNHNKYCKL